MRTTSEPWSGRQIAFVGGLHRSGTTFVARILGSSPDASRLAYTGAGLGKGQHIQGIHVDCPGNTPEWSFHPRAHLTEENAKREPGAGARLWRSWSPFWDVDRTVLVHKSPPNLTNMRYLQEFFPKSRFIVVTRHPVMQALAVRKWAARTHGRFTYGFPRLIEHWVRAHDVFAEDVLHIENLLVLRYEHLMRDPAQQLGRAAEFLGIELDGTAVHVVDDGRSNRYAELWETGGRRQLGGRVRTQLAHLGSRRGTPRADLLRAVTDAALLPRYRSVISEHLGERIRAHGYDLDALDEAAPWVPASHGAPTLTANAR